MFTRGSRLFFGLAAAGFVAAVIYGVITNGSVVTPVLDETGAVVGHADHGGVWHNITGKDAMGALLGPITLGYKGGVGDHTGYTLLMGFAVAAAAMGLASSAFRDADPESVAELTGDEVAPPIAGPGDLSPWPLVGAFGVAIMVVGLAAASILFAIGVVVTVIAMIEWTVKAWSEQATGDAEVNRIVRARLMHPIELPVAAVLLIATVVFCFSRVLLQSSEEGSIVWGCLLAALILGVGLVMGVPRQVRRGVVVGVLVAVGLTVIGLGIWGAVRGEREFEKEKALTDSVSLVELGETS